MENDVTIVKNKESDENLALLISLLAKQFGKALRRWDSVVCLEVALCLPMVKKILVLLGAQRLKLPNHLIERSIMEKVIVSAKI